ncbi:hypothetical protein Droror1_Dr00002454 [Drosera rotundifolia]
MHHFHLLRAKVSGSLWGLSCVCLVAGLSLKLVVCGVLGSTLPSFVKDVMEESSEPHDDDNDIDMEDLPMSTREVQGELRDHHSPEWGKKRELRQRRTLGRGLFRQMKEMIRDSVWKPVDAITPDHRRQRLVA